MLRTEYLLGPVTFINVSSTAVDGVEKLLPEPAMGNMKPDSAGYKEKWQEKRNRQLEDAATTPIMARPLSIQAACIAFTGEGPKLWKLQIDAVECTTVADFYEKFHSSGRPIIGVHPTTHSRIIINEAIRHSMEVGWLLAAPKINPWHAVCPPSEAEYPLVAKLLELPCKGPLEDTLALMNRLGSMALPLL